jgi:hypothetical protein
MPLADALAAEPEALLVAAIVAGTVFAWRLGAALEVGARHLSLPLFVLVGAPDFAGLLLIGAQLAMLAGGVDAEAVTAFGIRLGTWREVGSWVNLLVVSGGLGLVAYAAHAYARQRAAAEGA